jgi:uncharacterized protein
MTIFLWVLAGLFIIAGLLGTLLPMLPGVPFVFVGLVLAAWAGHFEKVGWVTLLILGVLTVLSFVLDFLATLLGTKKFGASKLAVLGAAIGAIAGFFFGIPGIVLGPFIGALIGEFIMRKNLPQAGKAGLGTWLGLVLGIAAKVVLIFIMVALFAVSYILK